MLADLIQPLQLTAIRDERGNLVPASAEFPGEFNELEH